MQENESPDLSQSDKSSNSSNESASFKWESLTKNLDCGQQVRTRLNIIELITVREDKIWNIDGENRQIKSAGDIFSSRV